LGVRFDQVTDAELAVVEQLGPETATVHQRRAHTREPGELLEVRARLRQPQAADPDRADAERATDEPVERHALGHEVAPGVGLRDVEAVGPDRVDRFALDQRHVARATSSRREGTGPERVPVAGEADARPCRDGGARDHRRAPARGHEDADQPTPEPRHLPTAHAVAANSIASPGASGKWHATYCPGPTSRMD